jgi:hypothetical protein
VPPPNIKVLKPIFIPSRMPSDIQLQCKCQYPTLEDRIGLPSLYDAVLTSASLVANLVGDEWRVARCLQLVLFTI